MSGGRKAALLRPAAPPDTSSALQPEIVFPTVPKTSSPLFLPLAWVQNLAVAGVIGGLRLFPYATRVALGGWVMRRVIGPLARYDRRVRDNLALILPDLPQAEVARITSDVLDNMGRTLAELYSPRDFRAVAARAQVSGAGLAPLMDALGQKRPVILISGHYGNHDIARAWLAEQGQAVGALYRPQRNPYFDRHFAATIRAVSEPLFARGRRGLAELVTHLKSGGALGMLIDQHMGRGTPLTFLGHRALTALSAAELALKYDCLLVPVYGIRQPDGLHFALQVEAPVPHSDAVTMTQALNDSLAAQVRAHPGQWFWVHRRWK
jgi:Kdo2-lipid IVA lauroyltransferase/acyltransferase